MPNRAAFLLRRLSVVDSKLKKVYPSSSKDPPAFLSYGSQPSYEKKYSVLVRSSTTTPVCITPTLRRSLSDNTVNMSEAQTSQGKSQMQEHKHTNRLINEKSPYLLQHAHNPVDWYPWCEEAFNKAKAENKLIFLSVGYSTCHWCHVMEHESFESEDVAKIMNEHYINIKVDREERPDVDRVYMLFITATSGHGGWPMSVFLTPDLKPVTGGTYFPPENKYGRPGFKTILLSLAQKWASNKDQFNETANNIIEALKKVSIISADDDTNLPNENAWNQAIQKLKYSYEPEYGGFGTAPKFPQAPIFNFLFHFYARNRNNKENKVCLEMCLYTLKKMALGGIHDHVSSGFARYSVDHKWHVPHFEKMLYDQAQLTVTYTDAYLASKDEFYADVVRDIVKYVNRDLRHSEGGYFSAEDADSYPSKESKKKQEGAFCVWEYDEIVTLFEGKPESYLEIFCDYFGVEPNGNISSESDPHGELTNKNVLIIYGSKEETAEKFKISVDELNKVIGECIDILYNKRQTRPRPHLDTKILCSWNGLMISGLAKAGQGLSEKCFVEDAVKCAMFIRKYLFDESNQTLMHSVYQSDDGSIVQTNSPIKGFMDDYAFLIRGLLDLYEASLHTQWLTWAKELQNKQNELFWDTEQGGYFTSSIEDPNVLLRLKEDQDGAEPSGNSVSCQNLLRLAAYSDKSNTESPDVEEREKAKQILTVFSDRLTTTPNALPEMLSALMFYTDSPTQVLIAGGPSDPRTLELVRAVRSRLLPGRVLAVSDPADPTSVGMSDILMSRIRAVGDQPTAYVCRRYSCSLPVTDVEQLGNLLDENN